MFGRSTYGNHIVHKFTVSKFFAPFGRQDIQHKKTLEKHELFHILTLMGHMGL